MPALFAIRARRYRCARISVSDASRMTPDAKSTVVQRWITIAKAKAARPRARMIQGADLRMIFDMAITQIWGSMSHCPLGAIALGPSARDASLHLCEAIRIAMQASRAWRRHAAPAGWE